MSFKKNLNKLISGFGFVIERSTPAVLKTDSRLEVDFDFLVRHEIDRLGGVFSFVEIGANDGDSRGDDFMTYVREFGAKGVMVEPQPDIFSKLKSNCEPHPGVVPLNKAVHNEKTSMTLYRFNPSMLHDRTDLPQWAKMNGIASFSRQHVLAHARKLRLNPNVIEELTVDCITLDDLLAPCDRSPDLLKIDVEGYDYEILNALDLDCYRPGIIRFENLHMKGPQYQSIVNKLSAAKYRFLANKKDTTAYFNRYLDYFKYSP